MGVSKLVVFLFLGLSHSSTVRGGTKGECLFLETPQQSTPVLTSRKSQAFLIRIVERKLLSSTQSFRDLLALRGPTTTNLMVPCSDCRYLKCTPK